MEIRLSSKMNFEFLSHLSFSFFKWRKLDIYTTQNFLLFSYETIFKKITKKRMIVKIINKKNVFIFYGKSPPGPLGRAGRTPDPASSFKKTSVFVSNMKIRSKHKKFPKIKTTHTHVFQTNPRAHDKKKSLYGPTQIQKTRNVKSNLSFVLWKKFKIFQSVVINPISRCSFMCLFWISKYWVRYHNIHIKIIVIKVPKGFALWLDPYGLDS